MADSFDIVGALKAGYTPQEVADHLGSTNGFDVDGARKSGYTDTEIINHMTGSKLPANGNLSSLLNPTKTTYDPTEGMSTAAKFGAGYGKAGADLARGAGQMVGAVSRQDVADARQRDAPLMATGAGKAGNITGSVADLLPAAFIPGANTLGGAAAIGGLSGLLQPSASTGETLANTGLGAAAGPASLLAGRAVGSVAKGLKASLWDPFTQKGQESIASNVLQAFAGKHDPAAMQSALTNLQGILPGVQPTTAELAGNGGLAQLQKTLSANPEQLQNFTQRAQSNRAAMTQALQGIAQSPGDRTAAVAARGAASSPLYQAANDVHVPMDKELQEIMQRPSMQSAMTRAQQLAAERGDIVPSVQRGGVKMGGQSNLDPLTMMPQEAPAGGSLMGQSTALPAKAGTAAPNARTGVELNPLTLTPQAPQISGKTIQYLKMSLNDIANSGPQMGMGSHELGAVKSTLGALNSWTEKNVPALRQADATYAGASKPINQMDVGTALSNKLLPALTDFGQNTRLNANAFAQGAGRGGDAIAADVTGQANAKLSDILSASQMTTVKRIGEQLARTANAAELGASKGSPTAQNLISQNVLGQFLGPLGLPNGMASRIAGSALGKTIAQPGRLIYGAVEPDIMSRLGQAALDPKTAARLLAMQKNNGAARALWNRQGLLNSPGVNVAQGLLGNSSQQ